MPPSTLSRKWRFCSLGVLAISTLFQIIALSSPGWFILEGDDWISSTGPIWQKKCHKRDGTCESISIIEELMSTGNKYSSILSLYLSWFIKNLVVIVVCLLFCLVVIVVHIVSIRNPRADMYHPVGSHFLAVACTLQLLLTVDIAVLNSLVAHEAIVHTPWSLVLYGISSFFNLLVFAGYFTILRRRIKPQHLYENLQIEPIPLGRNFS